jgi:hypothetical protein
MRSFGDWRPIRNAIEAAYRELGEDVPSSIPERDWNLAGLSITLHERASMPRCTECKEPFDNWHAVIRCLDCKAPLCERCAPRHFWPNGRPASEATSPRPAAADAGVRADRDTWRRVAERLERERHDLVNGCNALLGLIQLVCSRDDMPPAIREALETSHRLEEARASLSLAAKRGQDNG